MVFDKRKRSYLGSKEFCENSFDYLNRSSTEHAGKVREFLNYWVSKFPLKESKELISRIHSGGEIGFNSATFEIVLYAIVRKLGFDVTVHPELENDSRKHPDFLVTGRNGDEFYLEAVLASEFSESKKSEESRKNVILDAIENINSSDFQLEVIANGSPRTPPSGKKLRKIIERWLATLNVDEVRKVFIERGMDFIPKIKWNHDGWNVEFGAIPVEPNRREHINSCDWNV